MRPIFGPNVEQIHESILQIIFLYQKHIKPTRTIDEQLRRIGPLAEENFACFYLPEHFFKFEPVVQFEKQVPFYLYFSTALSSSRIKNTYEGYKQMIWYVHSMFLVETNLKTNVVSRRQRECLLRKHPVIVLESFCFVCW